MVYLEMDFMDLDAEEQRRQILERVRAVRGSENPWEGPDAEWLVAAGNYYSGASAAFLTAPWPADRHDECRRKARELCDLRSLCFLSRDGSAA